MTTGIIERLAKILCEKHGFYSWESDFTAHATAHGNLAPDDYREMIRAILTEMRKAVTEEMLQAMGAQIADAVPEGTERRAWQAAIDVALAVDGLKTGYASTAHGDLPLPPSPNAREPRDGRQRACGGVPALGGRNGDSHG